MRGTVVEWLKRLNYGAESRRKVVSSGLGFAMRRLENFVIPAVNAYLFFESGKYKAVNERDGLS